MHRKEFIKLLLGAGAATVVPLPTLEIVETKSLIYITSLSEWMSIEIQREIDYEMIQSILLIMGKHGRLSPLQTMEEAGYVYAVNKE